MGGEDGEEEAYTEGLSFYGGDEEESLKIKDVPPIAFSEGMRMASAIYGKRLVEKETENV